jgi:hypothetical protein
LRVWWRRWHDDSDAELDNTHLMRMAGRFARRVKAWGAANDVPVMFCTAGQRKHRIAEEYLATHQVGIGVFLVLVAKAPARRIEARRHPHRRCRPEHEANAERTGGVLALARPRTASPLASSPRKSTP